MLCPFPIVCLYILTTFFKSFSKLMSVILLTQKCQVNTVKVSFVKIRGCFRPNYSRSVRGASQCDQQESTESQ